MTKDPKSVKILLVDDSEVMLRHVSGLLVRERWLVVNASTTASGIEAFYKHRPDALLADFVLEGGDTGLGLISAIFAVCQVPSPQASSAQQKPLAAILTQGALSPPDQQRAAGLGVPILQKPAYGKEQDFILSVSLWLRKGGLV